MVKRAWDFAQNKKEYFRSSASKASCAALVASVSRCQQILNETGDHRGFFIVHKWDDFGARLRHQIVCSRISRLWWINHTRCDGGSIHGFASSPSDGYEVTWIPGAPESHGHPLGDWCTRHRINDIDMQQTVGVIAVGHIESSL